MTYILCLETSGTNCSVALSQNGKTIALKESNNGGFEHGEKLHLYIDEVLKKQRISPKELQAVAVSQGPGSYTGIRIGAATAKGLCFALNIPLIAIPTLQILKSEVTDNEINTIIIPMLDARRMEVYAAIYSPEGKIIAPAQPMILNQDSFLEYADKKIIFLGDGAEKFKAVCKHQYAIFLEHQFPSAEKMSPIAFEKYQQKKFENLHTFEPSYLK